MAEENISTRITDVGRNLFGEDSLRPDVTGRVTGRRRGDRLIVASASLQQAVDLASSLARSNHFVLIEGPDGSGRSHVARAMHGWSQHAGGPMMRFSAAGLSAADQEAELFGSESMRIPGALAQAAGGTLVVMDIGALDPGLLTRLREAVDVPAAGGSAPCRFMATGPAGVGDTLAGWSLRRVALAGLHERKEDILPLAAHFLAEFAEDQGLAAVGFAPDARRWLVEDSWPGNVRELRERVRQAVRLSGSGAISAEALMLSAEGEEVPSFKEAKRAFETRYVEGLLRRCSGNISRAARLAKKDRKDFYDVIRRTGVDPARFRT
jgi:two-component system response regulator GlrR